MTIGLPIPTDPAHEPEPTHRALAATSPLFPNPPLPKTPLEIEGRPPQGPFFIQARWLEGTGFAIEAGWRTDIPATWFGLVSEDSRIGRAMVSLMRSIGTPPVTTPRR